MHHTFRCPAHERPNKEIQRRTRVGMLLPNKSYLLSLVIAVLNEISDEWDTGRVYLSLQDGFPITTELQIGFCSTHAGGHFNIGARPVRV